MTTVLTVALLAFGAPGEVLAQELLWSRQRNNVQEQYGNVTRVVPDFTGDDLADVVISAPGVDCTSTDDGLVELRHGSSAVTHFDWCGNNELAGVVDWVSDVDGDGVRDLLVGGPAYWEPTLGRDTGRVVLLSGASGLMLWSLVGEGPSDYFGAPLVRIGDVNQDGLDEFLVSAVFQSTLGHGRVYLVSSSDATVIRTHTGKGTSEMLGYALARLDDVDGDAVPDYAISTLLQNKQRQGRIDVYSGASGVLIWSKEGAITAAVGHVISAAGDWNGDGHGDLMTYVLEGDGVIRIYSPATDQILFEYAYTQLSGRIGDDWGRSFCRVGDIDADGVEDFAIGVQFDGHDGLSAGRVDLVSGRTFRVLFRFYPGYGGGGFGRSVESGGDVNGDGIFDLVVGAPYDRNFAPKSGKVSVFALNDLYLQAEPQEPIDGDTVIVELRAGSPGLLGLIALTAVDGVPLFETLLLGPFDSNGELQLCADVDASLSGLQFTVMGYAQNKKGRGPLIDASPFTVSVQ